MAKATTADKRKVGTSLKVCSCTHPAQDRIYGKGLRLHNNCSQLSKRVARCTVCGRDKS